MISHVPILQSVKSIGMCTKGVSWSSGSHRKNSSVPSIRSRKTSIKAMAAVSNMLYPDDFIFLAYLWNRN